jgi:hypothetical protein
MNFNNLTQQQILQYRQQATQRDWRAGISNTIREENVTKMYVDLYASCRAYIDAFPEQDREIAQNFARDFENNEFINAVSISIYRDDIAKQIVKLQHNAKRILVD